MPKLGISLYIFEDDKVDYLNADKELWAGTQIQAPDLDFFDNEELLEAYFEKCKYALINRLKEFHAERRRRATEAVAKGTTAGLAGSGPGVCNQNP
jgi:hypothetical protein